MSDSFYGKGINVASGFDLGAKTPLDSRSVVNNHTELEEHVANNRVYEGMIVYVIEEEVTYQYINGEWETFGSSGSENLGVIIDNLNSLLTNASLSANQGRVLREMIESLSNNTYTIEEIDAIKEILEDKTLELEEKISNVSGRVHIGTDEPAKDFLWIDTSTPSNLKVVNYNERVKLKYSEMLESVKTRLNNLSEKITLIETNINKISSENADKVTTFKATLSTVRSQITMLISQIENIQLSLVDESSDLETLKTSSKKIRKDSKSLIYTLLDFNDEVMRVLDSELTINNIIDDDNDDDDDDVTTSDVSLLTEDGLILLTEDGLILLVDGVEVEETLEDSLLTETGLAILTESGLTLLVDKVESSEVLANAILTELGVVILTEQGKQILKG